MKDWIIAVARRRKHIELGYSRNDPRFHARDDFYRLGVSENHFSL